MKHETGKSRKPWMQVILVVVMMAAGIVSFYLFTVDNRNRILEQNQNYIEDATLQTARRLEDLLSTRSKSIDVLAITVEEKIMKPWVGPALLSLLQDSSDFDYVEFIDSTGLNHNSDGVESDSRDRENYIEGMKGNTGMNVVYNSRITHETLVIFYTPIRFNGEIIGVLDGMYREATLREALETKLFDMSAKTYLCMKDGRVISSHGDTDPPADMLLSLKRYKPVSDEVLEQIEAAFESHSSLNYVYRGPAGIGNASLTALRGSDWMLIQTFPSELSNVMERNSNYAGMRLLSRLLIIFILYLACLVFRVVSQRKKLTSEKERLSWIIEGLVPLFKRLVIVDYEKGSYEYLENTQPGVPAQGELKTLVDFIAPKYIEESGPKSPLLSKEELVRRLSGGTPYIQYEYAVRWDGEERWENMSVLSLGKKEGVPAGLLFAVQDVTQLKEEDRKIRETLRNAYYAAEEANHAKSDFLARMSHDMRTPMNAVMGMTSIALMNLDDDKKVKDCLEKISASSRLLLSLINEVLDMSKIESGTMVLNEEAFSMAETVKQCVEVIRPQAEQKAQKLDTEDIRITHDAVSGDPVRLRQVLVNLLTNAVKYTPDGGRVNLRARELASGAPDTACYEFVVEDTGIGMEPEFVPRLFEPFTRSKLSQSRNIDGTGLGMPIAKTIAQLMSGDIHVETEAGKGSRFTVQLYLKILEPQKAEKKAEKPSEKELVESVAERFKGVRVLLAEDNELNAEIAIELMELAGIQTELAKDGKQAVEKVKEHPAHYFDLIFMDIQMPVMNGYEAAREIRAIEREDISSLPIIAMSANAFLDDVRRSGEAGMDGHLAKPVEPEELYAVLGKWLSGKS